MRDVRPPMTARKYPPRKPRAIAANGRPKAGKRGEGGGRPKADPAKVAAALALLEAEGLTCEEAAARVGGISGNTVRRARDAAAKAAEAGTVPTAVPPPRPRPTPRSEPSPVVELPQGGSVSMRPDTLVLVRRILLARDPSALDELDAGLLVAARGEGELTAWLARPISMSGEDIDPLDALATALTAASSHANRLPPLHPRAASVLGLVSRIAERVEKVTTGRPRVPTADEVTERINARRDEATRKILEYTIEARAKLVADRAALDAWAVGEMAPKVADELRRRMGEMLGEKEGGGDGG
jgi:hypothetical protein